MGLGKIIHKFIHYDGKSVLIDEETDLHGTFYSPKKLEANDVGVIICHGLTLFRKLFEPMAKVIRNRGFDVLTMTFRGHGLSRFGKNKQLRKLTLENALEDVKHSINFMQNPEEKYKLRSHKKVILVGHSLGALMSLKASICDNVKQDIVGVVLVGCPIKLADYKFRTAAIFGAAKFLANVDFSEVRKQLKNFDAMVDIEKVDLPTIMIYGKLDELLLLYQKKPELLEKAINDVNSDVDFETIDGMFHNSINLLHKLGVKTSVEKCHKLIADWIEKHAKN